MCHTKEETCVICLENAKFKRLNSSRALAIQKIRNKVNVKEMGELLKCGHIFHRKCILPWFLNLDNVNSYNCPMCRGDIVFSNNLGMRNDFLYYRKYGLEDKKAIDEGYYQDEYDEEYEEAFDQGENGYDDDFGDDDDDFGEDDDGELSEVDSHDYVYCEEIGQLLSRDEYRDFLTGERSSFPGGLRRFMTHEGDIEDDESIEPSQDMYVKYYSNRVSFKCEQKLKKNELEFLSKPKLEIYSFRPHQSSIAI